jgi:molybdopterin-containing oxidoreductase family membrane subunit
MNQPILESPWDSEQHRRAPAVGPDHRLTEKICGIVERPAPRWWLPAFLISLLIASGALIAAAYLISTGVGVWGENQPVGWAFDITNFVFWIGIGHAGTLISAILFLLRQKWRTSINRFAEAMTLFAVACAGVYPLIHVGRVWMVWFLAPIPNANAIWPNFRSPLLWDVFAVSTYATVSLLFWYIGMIPDLASLRDRAVTWPRQMVYGLLALGWRGSGRHWHHYEFAYLLLAGLATPLVVSVHTIVSFDFATSVIPGWHTTIFPPYFVAGAIFSGFAMVLTLMIPARELFGLRDLVTDQHLDKMSKVLLATSLMVGYAYGIELFTAWYSVNFYERFAFHNRLFGPLAWGYAIMVFCNVAVPQLLWVRRVRGSVWALFVISVLVNVGMWFERFVIIVSSLERDFLPSSWGRFIPTWVDVLQMVGVFGLFFTLMLLFVRFLPLVAISEVKATLPRPSHAHEGHLVDNGEPIASRGKEVLAS